MKRTSAFLALTVLALLLSLGACSEPEAAVIDVTEDILEDATWSGQVNVTGEINILENAVITIEPGTNVRFANGSGLTFDSGASIVAIGSANSRISFGAANDGEKWLGIYLDDYSIDSEFAYCDFSDSGFENTYAIGVEDGKVVVISYCEFDGNAAGGVNADRAAVGTSIRYCTFGDNGDDEDDTYGPYDYVYDASTCVIEGNTASSPHAAED